MKKTLAIILATALLLLAVALGLNGVTRIRAQKDHVWLMETLLPGGRDFKRVTYTGEDALIRSVHQADIGFVIEAVTMGYADEIVMYIGVNNEGNVTGLVCHRAHETGGLGSGILYNDAFLSQFLNKSGSFRIGAGDADAASGATDDVTPTDEAIAVDGISGATVSSKAVVRCVNAAVAYVTGADVDSSATT